MDCSLLVDFLAPICDLDSFWLLAAETSPLAGLGNTIWVALQVAIGLGFVIFVHELGHFLAAKTFGVRCDKFYVGFDVPITIGPIKFPRTLAKYQWGETEYGIGIIPLGGYVKMLGQDDDPRRAEDEASKIRMGEGEEAPLDPGNGGVAGVYPVSRPIARLGAGSQHHENRGVGAVIVRMACWRSWVGWTIR